MPKKRKKQSKFPEDLFFLMAACDSDDLPDGAWQALIEDSVHFYNGKNSTNFDPNEAFHAYIQWTGRFTEVKNHNT